jgi:hypothetical protein
MSDRTQIRIVHKNDTISVYTRPHDGEALSEGTWPPPTVVSVVPPTEIFLITPDLNKPDPLTYEEVPAANGKANRHWLNHIRFLSKLQMRQAHPELITKADVLESLPVEPDP